MNTGASPLTAIFTTLFGFTSESPYFDYGGKLMSASNPVPPGGSAVMGQTTNVGTYAFAGTFADGGAASIFIEFS